MQGIHERAVVLLSGGLDSSTALAIAREAGYELYALSFDYCQRHAIELDAARNVAAVMGVKKHLVAKIDLREIGRSALTSDISVPKNGPSSSSDIPITYVPARNTIFLSFAIAWAEVLEAGEIYIGANAVDYSGYPDCRPQYLRAFEEMANLATKISTEGRLTFRIQAPLLSFRKSDIIRKGIELGLDYALTWSCYDPQPRKVPDPAAAGQHLVPCGLCDSCRLRQKGFAEAGIADPQIALNHTKQVQSLI